MNKYAGDRSPHKNAPETRDIAGAPHPLMRAARYHKVDAPFTVDLVEKPKPRSTDVLVEVHACGIVPNLRNVLRNATTIAGLHTPQLPAIYGLDAAGVIVEKGAQVRGLELGDRVYVNPRRTCGSCRYCRAGEVAGCNYWALSGYFGKGPKSPEMFDDYPYGGYSEFMTAPQSSLIKLPDNVDFNTAARWGYLGTSFGALRNGNVGASTNVLINGISGTLGIGAALFALALGAPKILGTGRNAELLERVRSLAPDRIYVFSTSGGNSLDVWARALTDGYGADVVIDALPTGAPPKFFLDALAALRAGGRHVNIGGVYDAVDISFIRFIVKMQTLIGSSWFSTAQGQEMADVAESGCVNLEIFEHKVFPLEEINEALASTEGRNGGFTNIVVSPKLKKK